MSTERKNNKNTWEIEVNLEPYHRRWHGGCGTHTHGSRIGGAFGWSKKEWHRMLEERNRKNKALKKKLKNK